MKIWFTADTHFGHGNVIRYNQRPFSSVSEMDGALIDNWNEVIQPNDTIYHLGDFTLLGKKLADYYFQLLNGRIHVIPGGHDRRWNRKHDFFSISGHAVVVLPPLVTIKVPLPNSTQQQLIILCHYSMRVWDRSHYGSWHLYGHSHGNLPLLRNSLDVGVDCWEYQPVSLDKLQHEFED